jgi:hypothetical protein
MHNPISEPCGNLHSQSGQETDLPLQGIVDERLGLLAETRNSAEADWRSLPPPRDLSGDFAMNSRS